MCIGKVFFFQVATCSKSLKTDRLNIVMVKGNEYDPHATKTWSQSGERWL